MKHAQFLVCSPPDTLNFVIFFQQLFHFWLDFFVEGTKESDITDVRFPVSFISLISMSVCLLCCLCVGINVKFYQAV